MPLDSPPSGAPRGASTRLAGALLCVLLVNVCASLPAGHKCPKRLDCASEGRHFCKPGSAHCGPCLTPLVENQEGRCVVKGRHRPHGNVMSYPEVDQEIDFLHSVVEKQQVAAVVPKQSRTQAPETKQRSRPLKEISANSTDISPAPTPGPPTPQPRATGAVGRAGPIAAPTSRNDTLIILLITLCISVGTVALVLAAVCFIRFQKDSRSTQKVDYPAFKGAGMPPATANTISLGDKTLAQSAQMYHYQHQKQQMISMGKPKPEQKVPDSEVTSDEEEVGGDFTVYECPGLAPTGEMEVKNPLFDDSTLYYQGNHK